MLSAQQAAKRAVAARSSLQIVTRSGVGRRARRWRSDQIATLDSDPTYKAARISNPSLRSFSSKQRRQSDADMKLFFDTLRTFSTAMPQQLTRVNEDEPPPPPRSWREAAALQGYKAESSSWGWPRIRKEVAAAVVEESHLDDEEELEAVTYHFPEKLAPQLSSSELGSEVDAESEMEEKYDFSEELAPQLSSSEVRIELGTETEMEEELEMAKEETTETTQEELRMDKEEMLEDIQPALGVDTPTRTEENKDVQELEAQLTEALTKRLREQAMELFASATDEARDGLSIELVKKLFFVVSKVHTFHAYQILQYILERSNANNLRPAESHKGGLDDEELGDLYEQMCYSLRKLDPVKHRHGNIRSVVGRVVEELNLLPEEVQKVCFPDFVTSLVMQRSKGLGCWAAFYYNKITEWQLDLPAQYYLRLLSVSKYNRQDDLPYYDVLRQIVLKGSRPYPHIVLGAVQNMWPYNGNIKGTHVALESVIKLQTQTQTLIREQEEEISRIHKQMAKITSEGGSDEELQEMRQALADLQPPHSYTMNILSLEQMADAATRKNMVPLVLSVWDALDVMGLEPSEAIYESTILCFAQNAALVENAFAVMHDMEQMFTPSHAFITAFGTALKQDRLALRRADQLVESFRRHEPGSVQCTPSGLNALISAHAWRGYVKRCLDLLDAFRDHDWSPDAYSFAFALESLGKAAKRVVVNQNNAPIHPRKREALIESYFEAAEDILTRVEHTRDNDGAPVVPTHHFFRQYVELLCTLGEATTGGLVAQDFMEQTERAQLVCNKTLWRVASAHAENGNIDLARQFAASTSEALPFMESKIDSIEEDNNNVPDYEMAGLASNSPEPLDMASLSSDSGAAALADDGTSQLG